MAKVVIYTTNYCGFCMRAKQLLDRKKIPYTEIDVTNDTVLRQKMEADSGHRTVPQIFINDRYIGGCDDLYEMDKNGGLESLN